MYKIKQWVIGLLPKRRLTTKEKLGVALLLSSSIFIGVLLIVPDPEKPEVRSVFELLIEELSESFSDGRQS